MTTDTFDLPNGSQRSKRRHEEATEVFPGGVSHNIRYYEPHPIYVDRAAGAHIQDVDGNEYVDFWMNHAVSVLGHAHPDVVEAVREQAERGLHYGASNETALELGREVISRVPSAERVRLCGSGTEATMYATRIARAATDRPDVLKVAGGWQGGNTDLSMAVSSPFDEAETDGLPPGAQDHLHAFPLNDREAVLDLLDTHDVGGIILEPVLMAGGGVQADDSFLRFLREECDDRGVVLIFDEVVTGFRVSPGTYQERVGVTPDLTTFGKFLGGGLPVGAVAGRADLFEATRPDYDGDDSVLVGGGTFSMNPMTATAGLASLEVVDSQPVYEETEARGERVRDGLERIFADHGIDATVLGTSSMFVPHFGTTGPIESPADVVERTDPAALKAFHRRLIERGYFFLPGRAGSVSYQTTEDHLDGFLAAARDVAAGMEGVIAS
ncbi:MAG: glutamate-1-semialdehyde 2,1-aminomutase [Halobacteriales archaeon]|jgi:glutamate-1-semialdehyde 2,1-aminomutase